VTWLIKLYPPAWRRRYGHELAELISTQPASFGTAIDLIAGAIDAWLNPQSSTAATVDDATGAESMVSKMVQLRCVGDGPTVTTGDTLKALAVSIGGTLALVVPSVWAILRYGKAFYLYPYLLAFMTVSWLVPSLVSQRYTTFKGRSGRAQAVLIGGPIVIMMSMTMAAVWFTRH
jgi:hypothetical protein